MKREFNPYWFFLDDDMETERSAEMRRLKFFRPEAYAKLLKQRQREAMNWMHLDELYEDDIWDYDWAFVRPSKVVRNI